MSEIYKPTISTRFTGPIGEEYRLFKEAVPHHEELQNTIKDALQKYSELHQELPTITILEAGPGTGFTSIRILEADPRIRVLAVDNEEKILNQAKEVLRDETERITFVKDDILSFITIAANESIDGFASAFTLHNFPNEYRLKVFKELARVLKCGGVFINADKYANNNPLVHERDLKEQIEDFAVYDKLQRSDLREEWTKHYIEDETTKIMEQEQIDILKLFGFKDIKTVFRKRMEATIMAIKA